MTDESDQPESPAIENMATALDFVCKYLYFAQAGVCEALGTILSTQEWSPTHSPEGLKGILGELETVQSRLSEATDVLARIAGSVAPQELLLFESTYFSGDGPFADGFVRDCLAGNTPQAFQRLVDVIQRDVREQGPVIELLDGEAHAKIPSETFRIELLRDSIVIMRRRIEGYLVACEALRKVVIHASGAGSKLM